MSEWEQAFEELESATGRIDSARPGDIGAVNCGLRDRFYAVSRIAELAHEAKTKGVEVADAVRERIERALAAGSALEDKIRLLRAGLRAELIEVERTRAVLQALIPDREDARRSLVDYSA